MPVEYVEDAGKYEISRRAVERRGILQLAPGQGEDGYGSKITTDYIVRFGGRVYRVYAVCHSNVASHYILVKRRKLFIRTSWDIIPDEPAFLPNA
jgi:hypothetical protein